MLTGPRQQHIQIRIGSREVSLQQLEYELEMLGELKEKGRVDSDAFLMKLKGERKEGVDEALFARSCKRLHTALKEDGLLSDGPEPSP